MSPSIDSAGGVISRPQALAGAVTTGRNVRPNAIRPQAANDAVWSIMAPP